MAFEQVVFGNERTVTEKFVTWFKADQYDWCRIRFESDHFPYPPPRKWYSSADGWVFHGTSLSTVQLILGEGLKAGYGHHRKNGRTVQGHFFITGPDTAECVHEAKDRATLTRCSEWDRYKVPSGWSVPCVVAFRLDKELLLELKSIGIQCNKSAFEATPGTILNREFLLSSAVHVYFVYEELQNYVRLHRYTEGMPNYVAALQTLMICGGREVGNGNGTKRAEPLAWTHPKRKSMVASCGKSVVFEELPQPGWVRSDGGFWFCRKCYNRKFYFWN